MRSKKKWFWIVPAAIVGTALVAFIGGEVVMHLWNWLLPPLVGLPALTFWRALGLLALCRILFGGLGGHGPRHNRGWRFRDRCRNLTPEEREKFRRAMAEGYTVGAPGTAS